MRGFLETPFLDTAHAHRDGYRSAQPFPHAVFDGLFPDEVVRRVAAAFPDPDDSVWRRYARGHEIKLEAQGEDRLPEPVSDFLHRLNSAPVLRFLETLTGIEGLLPDPYFFGGGLHQIEPGGLLDIHADFNHHPRLPLFRRLNLITYLNEDWQDCYGGHLELWDGSAAVKRIRPDFNRTVVFTISKSALHGHPQPLQCPPGRTRRSVAVYYYTVDPPPGEGDGAYSTRWHGGGQAGPARRQARGVPAARVAKELVPPVVWRGVKRLAEVRRRGAKRP